MKNNYLNFTHDASRDLFVVLNDEYIFLEFNQAWEIFQVGLISTNTCLIDLIHQEDVFGFKAYLNGLQKTHDYEFRLKVTHEKYLWFKLINNSTAKFDNKRLLVISNIDSKKKTQTHFYQLEQMTEIGTWEIDLSTNELYWSDMTYKIHEVDSSYKPNLDDGISFFHPESQPLLKKAIENTLKTGHGYDLKLKLITAKGRHRWVHAICKVELKDGALIRSYGSIQDITKSYEDEIKMRESSERYEAIINNIPIMLSLFSESGEFEWVNKGWETELGWNLESMKNNDMMCEFYPDKDYRKNVLDFMLKAESGWKDFYTKRKDGTFIHTSWANIKLSNGKLIGIGNNIEIRKKLEQKFEATNKKLQSMNERMELALKVTKFGVWDWDLKTMVLNWDKYMFDLFSYPESEFENSFSSFESRLLPEDSKRINLELQDCFANHKSEFKSEFKIKIPDSGLIKVIAVAARCFYDDEGKPNRLIGTNWDLTEQRKAEIKMLESSKFATLGEMAAGIAHEINNPLTIIKGKADQLTISISRGQMDLEKTKIELTKISNTVQRIAKIINGLRSFSRDSSNEPIGLIDLSKVIEDSVSMCFERFKSRGVRFMYSVPLLLFVQCRPIQLSQVILNLLNNAFDAAMSESEKWIQLDVNEFDDIVRITVTDSGKGIPEATVKKIMLPFFTTKEVGKGTGLGLSISKGIIDDHKGQLYYDHQSPNTRFVIDLPKNVIS